MKSKTSIPLLSDEEYSLLADFCDEHTPWGMDGLSGFLTAVSVAPGLMPPSSWFSKAIPEKSLLKSEEPQAIMMLTLRWYNEILSSLTKKVVMTPDETDTQAWERFAKGYVAGAQLDPEWIGDDARWTFAAPFAYLCGQRDLVPEPFLSKIESEGDPEETTASLRRQMGSIIVTTNDSFTRVRRESIAAAKEAEQADRQLTRVGRNDPCPCGSGKKHKKCCGAPTVGS
jgi:uncharacterized protein